MAVGGNLDEYAAFWPFLISDYDPVTYASTSVARGGFFTTDHQYQQSTVIPGNTWFYTRIAVDAEGVYTAVTSTLDYDSGSGQPFKEDSGTYAGAHNGSVVLIFNDNYGGTATHVILGEAIIRHTE
jgi:hypothetical protein